MAEFKCDICDKTFNQKCSYTRHKDANVPCDLVCRNCNIEKCNNRSKYNRHYAKCVNEFEKNDDKTNVINTNNNNNTNNTVNNNNNTNNVVMLQPFDVDHYYMKKDDAIGSKQETIIGMLRDENYPRAYEVLFKHVHGNASSPENHNIFLPSMESGQVVVFRGMDFVFEDKEVAVPRLFCRLKYEMSWL